MATALLITGATGKQGTPLIEALIKANADFELLALTRNAESVSAQKLQSKSSNIKLITGDLDDIDDVFQKAKQATKLPIWGVFSVQVAIGIGANAHTEEKQGKALIDASTEHGVKHFVYTSVDRGGARSDTDATYVPHFASKYRIEQHLISKAGEMGWTILRPVTFYENLVPNFSGKVFATLWEANLRKDQTLQLVATRDIGFFAAEAFLKPDKYRGQRISLVSDELTLDQFKAIFKKKTGQTLPTTFQFAAAGVTTVFEDMGYMFKWFGEVGYGADIAALRTVKPDLIDFGTWLEKESQFKTL